ncbi:hypothetical protein N9R48_01615, partial [Rickettsiales bacterium]|nr:hypothetical protein [Rickettsiales bacterium]
PPYYDKSDESYKSQNSKESSDSASSPVPNSPDRDGCDELDKSLLDMEEATDVAIETLRSAIQSGVPLYETQTSEFHPYKSPDTFKVRKQIEETHRLMQQLENRTQGQKTGELGCEPLPLEDGYQPTTSDIKVTEIIKTDEFQEFQEFQQALAKMRKEEAMRRAEHTR